jgi:hypothetical protein
MGAGWKRFIGPNVPDIQTAARNLASVQNPESQDGKEHRIIVHGPIGRILGGGGRRQIEVGRPEAVGILAEDLKAEGMIKVAMLETRRSD